jgi:PHD/YefM family antitoxin component YafN of YafNO toxin-antitoxin module
MKREPKRRRTKWTIARARQRFSELLRKTEAEPQAIYNRDRLVAAVISPGSFGEYSAWRERTRRRSIADAFDDLRRILAEEEYQLEIPPREDRRNEITEVLDELRR